jgi:hypothetical protein
VSFSFLFLSLLELSRPLADTIRRTAVEVAMKTQLVPQHFEQPVDELEFALNGMIQLHEDQLILLRQRIQELELEMATCTCGNRIEVERQQKPPPTDTSVALLQMPDSENSDLNLSDQPIGGLDSDQISVMSDSSATNMREFDDVCSTLSLSLSHTHTDPHSFFFLPSIVD